MYHENTQAIICVYFCQFGHTWIGYIKARSWPVQNRLIQNILLWSKRENGGEISLSLVLPHVTITEKKKDSKETLYTSPVNFKCCV